jgi:hypothetical protein
MGISYIGASKEKLGQAACCAVKRIHLDARIAKRAAAVGAHLKENFEVGRLVHSTSFKIFQASQGRVVGNRRQRAQQHGAHRASHLVLGPASVAQSQGNPPWKVGAGSC